MTARIIVADCRRCDNFRLELWGRQFRACPDCTEPVDDGGRLFDE